jgi:hypothetical protein
MGNKKQQKVFDKNKSILLGLNIVIAVLIFLTFLHSTIWNLLLLPIVFYYGALLRGENKINGLKKVIETDKVVGK